MRESSFAPIVIFSYNRLDHIKQTMAALTENKESHQSDVIVYSDAAKCKEDIDSVKNVREYLNGGIGNKFARYTVIERSSNYGLARNIIEGVTEVLTEYSEAIVLEDDIVVCPFFLKYMNDALKLYRHDEQVMEISGYAYKTQTKCLPETAFIYKWGDCWGWATWKRAWNSFEKNPSKSIKEFTTLDRWHFNLEGCYDFFGQIKANAAGTLNSWAVFWQASIYKCKGYTLYPTTSLIRNIGNDGSGVNCEQDDFWDSDMRETPVCNFPSEIKENKIVRREIKCCLRKSIPRGLGRIKYLVHQLI